DSAERLQQRVVARPFAERPGAPERADVAVDEARIARAQLVRSEAAPPGRPGTQALQEHVRTVDEAQQDVASALEVERERALAQVRRVEHHARVIPEWRSPRARLVAALRMLHLDDVGTERAENLRTVGPGKRARHVDDPHSLQRQELLVHTRATIVMLAFLNSLIDVLTGSVWTYPILFGICVGDAVFPASPRERAMIVCGIQAAGAQLSLPAVIAVGAAGAFVGDNTAYALGRWIGQPVADRFFSSERARSRLDRAERFLADRGSYVLIVARFVPGGRTATTFTAGLVHMRWLMRFVPFILIAAVLWAVYGALLGYLGGRLFENHPLYALLVAFGIATTVAGGGAGARGARQKGEAPARPLAQVPPVG